MYLIFSGGRLMFSHSIKDYKAVMCVDKVTLTCTLTTVSVVKKKKGYFRSINTQSPFEFENLLTFATRSFMNFPHFFSTLSPFRSNTSFFSVGDAMQHPPHDSVP